MSHCFHFYLSIFNNNWTDQIHIKHLFWVVIGNITDFITKIYKCQCFQLKLQKNCIFEVEQEESPEYFFLLQSRRPPALMFSTLAR